MVFAAKTQRYLFWILLMVGLLHFCYILLSYYAKISIKQFYKRPIRPPLNEQQIKKFPVVDDVLTGQPMPKLGSTIFFIDTSYRESYTNSIFELMKPKSVQFNVVNLTARAACAVESAALHNPNSNIFVLFASPVSWDETNENPIINAILSYENIQLRNLDLWRYAAGTPVEKWLQTEELFRSRYLVSHMSDFLRYLTLWRFGGTYLDMDIVVLRSLDDLPPNYAGAESESDINSAVTNFGYDDIGRKVSEYCLNNFQNNFNGQDWGNNGPGVITRTLKHICQTDQIAGMFNRERCSGFQIYKQHFFYAVPWNEWTHFFDASEKESTLNRIKKSYVVHVWNKLSKERKVRKGELNAYGELAAHHCPKVFDTIKEYF